MAFESINPATEVSQARFSPWTGAQVEQALAQVATATPQWQERSIGERGGYLVRLASLLRERKETLARLITAEMGKLFHEALAEIEKSARGCEHYAQHAATLLQDEIIATDARRSLVTYQPIGTVLAIMPWNFPFWQVFRFAAPALVAGNTAVLKHAANVPQCALAIEKLIVDAGFPPGVFRTLMIESHQVASVIADPRIHAVTLTGSEAAGRKVAALAGQHLKKSVLELGGSDAFIVLEDADLALTTRGAVTGRYQNAGQSCIAAKRFVVVDAIADPFVEEFRAAAAALVTGNPMEKSTTLAPLARNDLRAELHQQVTQSMQQGALAILGCKPPDGTGYFYPASILDNVGPGMRAYQEELFGPVATIIRVRNERQAIAVANVSRYGLGGSVWTRDTARGEAVARQLAAGVCFVNGVVRSDPRIPFGGSKCSGYGRELGRHGMLEFTNIKTLWID